MIKGIENNELYNNYAINTWNIIKVLYNIVAINYHCHKLLYNRVGKYTLSYSWLQPTLSYKSFIMEEIRKDIPWFDGYKVSNMWRVTSNWIIMQWCISKWKTKILNKYRKVRIAWKNRRVHCLVMLAFVWEKPEWFVIDHINERKYDNRLENLEYVTVSVNNSRACRNKYLFMKQFTTELLIC